MKGRRRERDKYADAGKAMRWAIARFHETQPEARWTAADTQVFLTVLRETASYSRLWDRVTVSVFAQLCGHHERTCAKSLKKLDKYDVISYEPGIGREKSRVALPTAEGRLAWASERRPHVAASQKPDEALAARDAPSESAASRTLGGGHMSPPQTRPHVAASIDREGFSRSKKPFEKQEQVSRLAPLSVEGDGSETRPPRGPTVYTDLDGNEVNPGTNEPVDDIVSLVAEGFGEL